MSEPFFATPDGCVSVEVIAQDVPWHQDIQALSSLIGFLQRFMGMSLGIAGAQPTQASQDGLRGGYLCETCFDAMTDDIVTIDGLEQAQCQACARLAVPDCEKRAN